MGIKFKIGLVILLLFRLSLAYSAFEIRSDFFFSGLMGPVNEMSFYTHNGVYIGPEKLVIGGIFLYELRHDYLTDSGYGVGIRYEGNLFFEIDGGYFKRKFSGRQGEGFFASLITGKHVGKYFSLALPIIVKRIDSGSLDSRWIVDVFPYLGLRIYF